MLANASFNMVGVYNRSHIGGIGLLRLGRSKPTGKHRFRNTPTACFLSSHMINLF